MGIGDWGYNNNGELVFEIKNGKGKGKEYYPNGMLKCEGEYLNGMKNGFVKEYNKQYGNLKFEGEYSNGIKIGKAKEYNYYGQLVFEGIYLEGEIQLLIWGNLLINYLKLKKIQKRTYIEQITKKEKIIKLLKVKIKIKKKVKK